MFNNTPFVTKGTYTRSYNDYNTYLTEIYNHDFSIAPRGAGIDTHRLWESLYVQSIPVCVRNNVTNSWASLPVYLIDDWTDITEDKLLYKYKEMQDIEYDTSVMDLDYWTNRIQQYKDML